MAAEETIGGISGVSMISFLNGSVLNDGGDDDNNDDDDDDDEKEDDEQ